MSIILTIIVIVVYIVFLKSEEQDYLKFVNIQSVQLPRDSNQLFDLDLNYVIANNCTDDKTIDTIQIVTSFAGNVEARSALRRAYPQSLLTDLGVYRVFLLALLKSGVSEVTQNAILNENERFNDIVQGNFIENYRNLTYKHLMGIKWAITKCHASYIVKMDDDIISDMYSLVKTVRAKSSPHDILGYILKDLRPIRLKANKWYVTKEEYSLPSYPTFVSGWLYVMSFSAATKLTNAIEREKYFWIDDVFVTGVLARKMNLVLEDMSEYFTLNPEYFECCMRDKVECGFFVGPSGGDYNLNIDFQKHSEMCHVTNCTRYTNGKTFKNSCVVSRKLPSIGKGLANLNVIRL